MKEYFVARMTELSELGSTVEEMLAAMEKQDGDVLETTEENTGGTVGETTEDLSDEHQNNPKTDDEMADEVILGLWGNGIERKQRLEEEGYDYDAIQEIVNKKLSE